MNEQLEIDFDYYASINPIELPYNQKTKTGYRKYSNGNKHWYFNDQLHREGGPAIICANGSQYWYLNDIGYSQEEWRVALVLRGYQCMKG